MTEITPQTLDRVERTLRERIDALEKLLTERREADQVALDLKSTEVERRLEALNHENARVAKVLENSIPREIFENYKSAEQAAKELARREAETAKELARKELQIWKDAVNAQLISSAASTKAWTAAIGVLVTLISLVIAGLSFMAKK